MECRYQRLVAIRPIHTVTTDADKRITVTSQAFHDQTNAVSPTEQTCSIGNRCWQGDPTKPNEVSVVVCRHLTVWWELAYREAVCLIPCLIPSVCALETLLGDRYPWQQHRFRNPSNHTEESQTDTTNLFLCEIHIKMRILSFIHLNLFDSLSCCMDYISHAFMVWFCKKKKNTFETTAYKHFSPATKKVMHDVRMRKWQLVFLGDLFL